MASKRVAIVDDELASSLIASLVRPLGPHMRIFVSANEYHSKTKVHDAAGHVTHIHSAGTSDLLLQVMSSARETAPPVIFKAVFQNVQTPTQGEPSDADRFIEDGRSERWLLDCPSHAFRKFGEWGKFAR